jgi:hypothetical protein
VADYPFYFKEEGFISINIILWQQQVCCALFDGWSY